MAVAQLNSPFLRRSRIQPNQRRHAAGLAIAAVGKKPFGIVKRAAIAAVNSLHTQAPQAQLGQLIKICEPLTIGGRQKRGQCRLGLVDTS